MASGNALRRVEVPAETRHAASESGPRVTIGEVFDSGSDDFMALADSIWDPLGATAVGLAGVRSGDYVMDACCGIGSSALPAAGVCGPTGHVDAVDLAPSLINELRRRAAERGLSNVTAAVADVSSWSHHGYDALICCYGTFFFSNMDLDTKRLTTLVRPGGRVTVMTWAAGAMVGFGRAMFDAIRQVTPEVEEPVSRGPAARIETTETMSDWLVSLGLERVNATAVPCVRSLSEQTAWSLVVGTGFRSLLPPASQDRERIRHELTRILAKRDLTSICLDSIVGTGTRTSNHSAAVAPRH